MINKTFFCFAALICFGLGTTNAQEIPETEFTPLFNGQDLDGWVGNKSAYRAENGTITVDPKGGGVGNLLQKKYMAILYSTSAISESKNYP